MSIFSKYTGGQAGGGGGSGTVTSVGLTLPNIFTVTGSPVTGSGTIHGTFTTQVANKVFAGPTTGSPATPTFRSLVAADIPALPYVSGPGSSVQYSAPVFADTSGHVLIDSQTSNIMTVPCGDYTGIPDGDTVGIQFRGESLVGPVAANTGILVGTYGEVTPGQGDTSLIFQVADKQMMRIEGVVSGLPEIVVNHTIRPEIFISNLGRYGHTFTTLYHANTIFGADPTNNLGVYSMVRQLWFTHGGWSSGSTVTSLGLGFNAETGSEFYVTLYDNTANDAYYDALSVQLDNHISKLTSKDDVASNSHPAMSMHLKGANKAAGTGAGGSVLLSGGTSSGGVPGSVYIPTTSGAPAYTPSTFSGFSAIGGFDPATKKLYIYDGTGWVSVTLS